MKKSELKNRMVVELRNGKRFIVVEDTLIGKASWITLSDYNEDLIALEKDHELDIVKVYSETYFYNVDDHIWPSSLLWERKEPIEVTMDEVEEKFGCKVKLVKEKTDEHKVNITCFNCKYAEKTTLEYPCNVCCTYPIGSKKPHEFWEPREEDKNCSNCKYGKKALSEEPCNECAYLRFINGPGSYSLCWEPRDER